MVKFTTLRERKTNFVIGLIIMKVNIERLERVNQNGFRMGKRKVPPWLFYTRYCFDGHSGTEDWDFVSFEQCATEGKRNILATQT